MIPTNPKIDDWRGLRVWLLGASAGIGEALALQLSARGARLALSGRDAGRLDLLAGRCGNGALALRCDASDCASVAAAWAELVARWQGVDLGIYMAGAYVPLDPAGPAETVLPAARRMLAVNYGGALEFAGHLAPFLAARRDRGCRGIVLVASVAGYGGLPRALGYGPTKAALINLAECLHLELASRGVGVWVVNPGFVATRLTAANDFPMPALISADAAATEIVAGLAGGGFEIHFPKRFSRLVKFVARLPYWLQLRLVRRFAGARSELKE